MGAKIVDIWGVLLAAVLLCYAGCSVAPAPPVADEAPPANATASIEPVALELSCVVRVAQADIGVKEVTVNGGPEVDGYLASVGLPTGHYWCSGFVHKKFRDCGKVMEPARQFAMALRWAQVNPVYHKGELDSYVSGEHISEAGNVYTLNYGQGKGHAGIAESEDEDNITGIEGNTNSGGSRNGDGVYRRVRDKETLWTVNRP